MRALYSERKKAWKAFKKAAKNLQEGTYNLDLIRLARVFTAAPKNDQGYLEELINLSGAQGNSKGVITFGRFLYKWDKQYG